MKINIVNQKDNGIKTAIKQAVLVALEKQRQPKNIELTIKFVSSDKIWALNKTTRNIDKPTDVLSYPSLNLVAGEKIDNTKLAISSFDGKNVYIGDCAICEEIAEAQALERGETLKSEVMVLVVHSVLHLLGYDHIKDEDYKLMHKKEKEILGELTNV